MPCDFRLKQRNRSERNQHPRQAETKAVAQVTPREDTTAALQRELDYLNKIYALELKRVTGSELITRDQEFRQREARIGWISAAMAKLQQRSCIKARDKRSLLRRSRLPVNATSWLRNARNFNTTCKEHLKEADRFAKHA